MSNLFRGLFMIVSLPLAAQPVTGTVLDEQTGLPVAYATIALIAANKGTTAGKDGQFTLTTGVANDTLLVSCVGYQARKVALQAGTTAYRVALARNTSPLAPVTIRQVNHTTTLPWSRGRSDFTLTTIGITTQVAQLLEAPEANTRLDAVTIATGSSSIFGERPVSRFLVRIYDYDSTRGQPGQELCDSLIEVSGRGIIAKDLRKYGILLPQKRFFVAVQWLFIEENGVPARDSYKPFVRMLNAAEGEGRSWLQSFNDRWIKHHADAGITATVSF